MADRSRERPVRSGVLMFWGDNDFLLVDAARDVLSGLDLAITEIDGSDWRGGETSDLATPSLWGERRALLVRGCQELAEAGTREVRGYVEAPVEDALCILTWVTHGKSAPALAKVVQGAGGQARQVAVARRDLPRWVVDRAKRRSSRLVPAAAAALVSTVGEDPAALDQAVEQLSVAFAGKTIGEDEVRAQFEGLGEARVWDLCDHALSGRVPQGLLVLRSMLAAREDPLLILGGIASRVRELIRVKSLGDRGQQPPDAARAAGLRFDWQLRRSRDQAARFSPEELASLHDRVVEADRALKGGMAGDIVLASLINVMAGDAEAALNVPVRVSR